MFAEAYNVGIPFELPHVFREVRKFHVDPSNKNRLLVVGHHDQGTTLHNKLALIDVDTRKISSISDYMFLTAAFAPDGGRIYAVAITKYEHGPNEGMET